MENVTSSTKPEVHNVQHRRHRATVIDNTHAHRENLVKLGPVDGGFRYKLVGSCRQTDRHAHHNTQLPYRERRYKNSYCILRLS